MLFRVTIFTQGTFITSSVDMYFFFNYKTFYKKELRCKRQEDETHQDPPRTPVGAAQDNHNNTDNSPEDNHQDNLDHEEDYSYAKGKQVSLSTSLAVCTMHCLV